VAVKLKALARSKSSLGDAAGLETLSSLESASGTMCSRPGL
jgi:hypothetical protein